MPSLVLYNLVQVQSSKFNVNVGHRNLFLFFFQTGFARKLLQSSGDGEIPTYSLGPGVTEIYLDWGGGALQQDTTSKVLSYVFYGLGILFAVIIVAAVIALIAFGVIFLLKKRQSKKAGDQGGAYVLMQGDEPVK